MIELMEYPEFYKTDPFKCQGRPGSLVKRHGWRDTD